MIRRAVTLADGFSGGNVPLDEVRPLVKEIKAAAEAAGAGSGDPTNRLPGTLRPHDTPQGPIRRPLWGTLEEIREDVRRYAEAGLTELFLEANFDPTGRTAERFLEVMGELALTRKSI